MAISSSSSRTARRKNKHFSAFDECILGRFPGLNHLVHDKMANVKIFNLMNNLGCQAANGLNSLTPVLAKSAPLRVTSTKPC